MARSPSPRRRSRSPARLRRSPSPRRRSPSPRRRSRSPYRRRSPERGGDRGRRPSPDYRRRPSPDCRPHRSPGRGGHYGGGRRDERGGFQQPRGLPRGPDDVSDDDIKAESFADYRRLKRAKLMERNVRCIWRNTPSPPPDRRHSLDLNSPRANGQEHAAALQQNGTVYEHPHERQQREELARARERQAKEDKAAAAAAAKVQAAEAKAAEKAEKEREKEEGGEGAAGGGGPGEAPVEEDEVIADIRRKEAALFAAWVEEQKAVQAEEEAARKQQEEEDALVGPAAPAAMTGHAADWGTHMRPGEGSAMAAFVQQGKRIPRRGEVGLDSEQIEKFEKAGYVMSGSRHSRMNAVRIRKENQVYSAEEKAALAMYNFEENKRKEERILADMKRLVDSTLGHEDDVGPPPLAE